MHPEACQQFLYFLVNSPTIPQAEAEKDLLNLELSTLEESPNPTANYKNERFHQILRSQSAFEAILAMKRDFLIESIAAVNIPVNLASRDISKQNTKTGGIGGRTMYSEGAMISTHPFDNSGLSALSTR